MSINDVPSIEEKVEHFGFDDSLWRNRSRAETEKTSNSWSRYPRHITNTSREVAITNQKTDMAEKEQKNDVIRINSRADPAAVAGGDNKPPLRFKLSTSMKKKLQQRTPIISGYTLEHFYRYGKPPFMNFGYDRNVRLTRY